MKNRIKNKEISSLSASEILCLLEEPTDDRRPLKHDLQRYASLEELIQALHISQKELTHRILCDIRADKHDKSAVPVLIECLDDPSRRVQDDAAEALLKIGSI